MNYIEVTSELSKGYVMAKYCKDDGGISFRRFCSGVSVEDAGKMLAKSLGFKEYIVVKIE